MVKDQVKRFKGFLSRLWIPITEEEWEIYKGVESSLVPYVETLLKQVRAQTIRECDEVYNKRLEKVVNESRAADISNSQQD